MEGYSTEFPISDTTFIGVAAPIYPNERWTVDPNPNLPREMTVMEAEEQSDTSKTFQNPLNYIFYLLFF